MSKTKHDVHFLIQSNDGFQEDIVAYRTYQEAEAAAKARYSTNGKAPVIIYQTVAVVGFVGDEAPVMKVTKQRKAPATPRKAKTA